MPEHNEKDYSKEFIIRMYDEFWKNIRNAEGSSWKVFFSYSVFIGIISFLLQNNISTCLIIILISLFTTIAVSISMNANLWFLRNTYLISRIEPKFEIYDIIPERWKKFKMGFINREIWTIHIILYLLIGVFIIMFFFPKINLCSLEFTFVIIGLSVSLLLTISYGFYLFKQYKKLNIIKYPPKIKIFKEKKR